MVWVSHLPYKNLTQPREPGLENKRAWKISHALLCCSLLCLLWQKMLNATHYYGALRVQQYRQQYVLVQALKQRRRNHCLVWDAKINPPDPQDAPRVQRRCVHPFFVMVRPYFSWQHQPKVYSSSSNGFPTPTTKTQTPRGSARNLYCKLLPAFFLRKYPDRSLPKEPS